MIAMSPEIPDITEMLLPAVVDHLAETEPDAIWMEFPKSPTSYELGFEAITYATLANAVNGIAHLLEETLGKKESTEPLAYLAPNDPRTGITILGAIKAGYALFLTSDRNSVAAHLKLFDDLDCRIILTTDPPFSAVDAILAERSMRLVSIPSIEALLSTRYPVYSYAKDFEASEDDIALIVHTSGSTGFPQPRRLRHGYFARAARNIRLEAHEGFQMMNGMIGNSRNALLLPLSHPAGVGFSLLNAIFSRSTVIIPLPFVPPTGQTLAEMLKHTSADWATTAPLTMETIAKDAALLDVLAPKLMGLLYVGGSLPKIFGDIIAEKIKLATLLGSSESGPLPTMYPDGFDFKTDWSYMQMHPAIGAEFEMQNSHVYELVLKRSPESDPYQTVFTIFPDLKEYRTKDLFTPHPTLPDVWTHASRSDDVIVFLSGEKINPITYESHIAQKPEVATVLMFGNQRFEAGLLIELIDQNEVSATERAKIIERLWSAIEHANLIAPAYAKVSKDHIRFTDPDKPIMRTAKGTVRRQVTLESYAPQIEQLYADVEAAWTIPGSHASLDMSDVESLKSAIRGGIEGKLSSLGDTEDFFVRGMDSLAVLRLVRHLKQETGIVKIEPSMIYLNSCVADLTQALRDAASNTQTTEAEAIELRADKIEKSLESLQKDVDTINDNLRSSESVVLESGTKSEKKHSVVVTGSTGSIGSYVLRTLLDSSNVEHVYCLNRNEDSETLQKERNANVDQALPQDFSDGRVTFLQADLFDPELGLESPTYKLLQHNVTLIIHNSWPVDFNLPLSSFKPHLAGVVNLIALSVTSTVKPPIIFLSSVSAVMNSPSNAPIAESISFNLSAPVSGYGESKYLAERILGYASKNLGLRTGIVRIGQICGAARSQGRWNVSEWIPSLVLSSKHLGAIPDSLAPGNDGGDIDWLPVDILGEVILDIALNVPEPESTAQVYQPMNPNRTSWSSLLPSIIEELSIGQTGPVRVVKPGEWLARLRKSAAEGDTDIRMNPALKLIDFFGSIFGDAKVGAHLAWDTKMALEASGSLRSSVEVDGKLMARWVKGWCESV